MPENTLLARLLSMANHLSFAQLAPTPSQCLVVHTAVLHASRAKLVSDD